MPEDEMVGWHHRLSGHESEQTPGDSDGQGSLACCSSLGCKQSDMTEQQSSWRVRVCFGSSPPLSPIIGSNSCLSSWWCYFTISSSATPFSHHPQSFLASGSFPVSQFFALGGQSIGASALASVLPMNIQD